MFTQAVLAAALNDIDTTNPQSIQDAKRHADAFRKVSPIKFPYPDLVKDDGGLLRVATTERSHPPGAPQLDTDLLRQLSMRIQDVFLNHAFDHTPQLRQEIVVVLGRVCTGLSEIAQHAQFYQHQLMTTHGLVGGVTALLRCDSPEASAHAALLLSQMALASPESAERLVMQKFFLDAVASMIGGRHEVAVDSAALLVNNCAGMGGIEVMEPMTKHAHLMSVLIERLESGNPLQLQRIVSAMNHLSRSSVSAKQLRARRVPAMLARLAVRREDGGVVSAYKGLATMALANMVGKDTQSDALSHTEALTTITKFLKAAINGTSYSGISFRVHDVLYPLSMLASNPHTHKEMLDNGSLDLVLKVVSEWQPGMFTGQFSAMRSATYPVLEVATDVMYELSHTPACRDRMLDMGIMPCLERLMASDSASVQTHASKVLWSIRDKDKFVSDAAGVAKAMDAMAAVTVRYNWTKNERTLRVNALLTEQGLGGRIADGCRWMLEAITNDKMNIISMILTGANDKTLGVFFRAFRAAVWKARAAKEVEGKTSGALRVMMRMMNQTISRSFTTWRNGVRDKQRILGKARSIVLEWKNQTISHAFRAWNHAVQSGKHMVSVCRKVVKTWINKTLGMALHEWVFHVKEAHRLSTAATRVLKRWTNAAMSLPFQTWRVHATTFARQRNVLHRMVMLMKNRAAAVAMQTWAANVREVKRMRLSATKVVARWTKKTISLAFTRWKENVEMTKRFRSVTQRVIKRWTHQSLSVAFTRWGDSIAEAYRIQDVTQRVLARWAHQGLSAAMTRWSDNVDKAHRLHDVTQRVLKRWTHQGLLAAINMWSDHVAEARRVQDVLGRVLARWTQQTISAALSRWIENVAERKRTQHVLQKVVGRWTKQTISAAFSRWEENIAEHKRAQNVLLKVVGRWTKQTLSGAMSRWVENFREARRLTSAAAKVVGRWMKQGMSLAFTRWENNVEVKKRLLSVTQRVLKRWTHQGLLAAINKWSVNAAELKRMNNVLQRVMSRWTKQSISAALSRWVDNTAEQKRMSSVLQKVVGRWSRQTIAAALNRWVESIAEKKRALKVDDKVVRMWANKGLAPAFRSWKEHSKGQKRLENLGSKVLMRLLHSTLWGALNKWVVNVKDQRRMLALEERCLAKWTGNATGKFFRTWQGSASKAGRARDVIESVLHHITHQTVAKALHTWKGAHAHVSRVAEVALQSLGRWLHQAVGVAFRTWKEVGEEDKRHRQAALLIVKRWRKVGVAGAFSGWLEHHRVVTNARSVAHTCVGRMLHLSTWRAWDTWASKVAETKRGFLVTGKILKRWSNLAVAETFGAWVENVAEAAHFKRLGSKIAHRWARLALDVPFSTWKAGMVGDAKDVKNNMAGAHARSVVKRMTNLLAHRVFGSWVQFTFNPAVLMADEEEDAAAPEIHMASQVRSADLGDSFEAVLAREIADALNISKSQVLLTSFESQSSTVFYKIVQDKTGYGRTNAEVYADAMYQLQEKNSKLRQCNIAGHVTSITLAGKKMAPNVVSVGASSHAMQSMKKGQLVASLQGAQHKVLEQEHCLSVLQAKYSSVMMNVGLDITVEAPHYVRSVHDFMDERGFLQGEEEYCNKMVERDDILVAVDDNDVADADMMQIRQWLRGPPYTVVSLTLKRDLVLIGEDGETLEENDEEMQELTYKVRVMRHISVQRLLGEEEVPDTSVGGAIQAMMRTGPLGFLFGKEEVHDDI